MKAHIPDFFGVFPLRSMGAWLAKRFWCALSNMPATGSLASVFWGVSPMVRVSCDMRGKAIHSSLRSTSTNRVQTGQPFLPPLQETFSDGVIVYTMGAKLTNKNPNSFERLNMKAFERLNMKASVTCMPDYVPSGVRSAEPENNDILDFSLRTVVWLFRSTIPLMLRISPAILNFKLFVFSPLKTHVVETWQSERVMLHTQKSSSSAHLHSGKERRLSVHSAVQSSVSAESN